MAADIKQSLVEDVLHLLLFMLLDAFKKTLSWGPFHMSSNVLKAVRLLPPILYM